MGGGIASRHAVAVAQHRYHFWQIRHYSDRRGAASGRCAKFASRRLDPHLVLASGTVLSTASLLDSVPHLASDAPLRGIILLQSGPLGLGVAENDPIPRSFMCPSTAGSLGGSRGGLCCGFQLLRRSYPLLR